MKLMRLFDSAYRWLDTATNAGSRSLARSTSRRSFLGKLGTSVVGMAAFPLLPVSRAFAVGQDETDDPTSCDYWRYCALSGSLCACCGGTETDCPPGSAPSTISWVGTCRNPADDRDYLISYNDCCGTADCHRCPCSRNEREKPFYFPSKSNAVLWCFGAESRSYHCTVAVVMGEAS